MRFSREVRRILAYRQPVDMRKQANGLIGVVQNVLLEDPLSGSLYVFRNRRGDQLKCVFWDRTGYCLVAKRLEHRRFHLPGEATKVELSTRAFELLFDGILLGPRSRSTVQTLNDAGRASRIAEP